MVVIKAFLKIRSQSWALLGLFAVRFVKIKGKTGKPRSVSASVVCPTRRCDWGSRECSHHFLSIHISARRLRPEFPNPAPPPPQPCSPTPLCRTRRRNSFSGTRLPPLCRAGVEWRSIHPHLARSLPSRAGNRPPRLLGRIALGTGFLAA